MSDNQTSSTRLPQVIPQCSAPSDIVSGIATGTDDASILRLATRTEIAVTLLESLITHTKDYILRPDTCLPYLPEKAVKMTDLLIAELKKEN